MFKRKIENKIQEHFDNGNDKILIVHGARQIGKTFIVRHVAKKNFKNYIEINLKDDFDGPKRFSDVKTIEDFYTYVSLGHGAKLGKKEDTIIFLDEIQVYPHLISMLKPLRTDNRYNYIASGSLLGITLKHTFIPAGSMTELKMYPMDFEEFLWANDFGGAAYNNLKECFIKGNDVDLKVHEFMLKHFKKYLLCGGLPDSVKELVLNKNIYNMRKVQSDIFKIYRDDCSQYDIDRKLKITNLYDLLASYMENKVKRVMVKDIENKKYSTYLEYEDEFEYLIHSGIALKTIAISNPKFPLLESAAKRLTKLYYNDVGILTNILYRENIDAVLKEDSGVNLGSVYETAVAMELASKGNDLFYFDSKKVGEVDFLINDYKNLGVLPIEIKSGKNVREFRAIPKLVDKKGNYKLSKGYIFSNNREIKKEGDLYFYPIYMIMFL